MHKLRQLVCLEEYGTLSVMKTVAIALLLSSAGRLAADCGGAAVPTISISRARLGLGGSINLDVEALEGRIARRGAAIRLADKRTFILELTGATVTLSDPVVEALVTDALKPSGLEKITFVTQNGFMKETARWYFVTISLAGRLILDQGRIRLSDKPGWLVRTFARGILEQSRNKSIVMDDARYVFIDPIKLLAPFLDYTGTLTSVQAGTGSIVEVFGNAPTESGQSSITIRGAGAAAMLGLQGDASEVEITSASPRVNLALPDLAVVVARAQLVRDGCSVKLVLP